jgi:hypothetical protein
MKARRVFVWLFYFLLTLTFCFKTVFSVKESGFSIEALFFSSLAGIGFYFMTILKSP